MPAVCALLGHGGAAEGKYLGAACKTKKRALLGKIRAKKHANAWGSTEREEKHPEGCEQDPKSMEESEENPPEGCNKDPKPVIPQPGAAQLLLAGLKTMEEGEKNKIVTKSSELPT